MCKLKVNCPVTGRQNLYVTIAGEHNKHPRPHRQGHLHTLATHHTNITPDITHTSGFSPINPGKGNTRSPVGFTYSPTRYSNSFYLLRQTNEAARPRDNTQLESGQKGASPPAPPRSVPPSKQDSDTTLTLWGVGGVSAK